MKRLGIAVVVLIAALLAACVAAFLAFGKAYRIVSPSMSPSLRPGDRVLVLRFVGPVHPDVGDIVAYRTPGAACGTPGAIVIHRITRKFKTRRFVLRGDNAREACDSRAHGTVARRDLIGQVVAVYWPPSHWGLR